MRRPVAFAVALLAVSACSFPAVTYDAGSDGSEDGPPVGDGPDEAGDATADSWTSDTTVPLDSPPPETSAQDVVSDYVFEAAPDAPPCDQDQDGYKATGSCGGNDCDDLDPHTNPGVTAFQTAVPPPTQPLRGDWNCDGMVQKQYSTDLACSGNGLIGCTGGSGFLADPGCGGAGPFGTCESSGGLATCMPVSTSSQTQGCL